MATRIALQSFNGQYLCAEGGGGQLVVANRNWVREWETFKVLQIAQSRIALQVSNGQYVCAEAGGGREVVANRGNVLDWETFTRIEIEPGKIALQASNGQYFCAEAGGGREVVANRSDILAWETFTLVDVDHRKFVDGRPMFAFHNNSNHTVFVKPENANTAVEVRPHEPYEGRIDGICVPAKMPNKVLKVVDNCDAEVKDDRIVVHCNDANLESFGVPWDQEIPGSSGANAQVMQRFIGGWKNSPPDDGWNAVFDACEPAPPPNRRVYRDRERPDPDRERFERMDRNQYDTWEREDREWVDRTA